MTSANLGELYYRLEIDVGTSSAVRALLHFAQWNIPIVDIDESMALLAAQLKSVHRLGYLDCFAAALAMQLRAPVVTGDTGFRRVSTVVEIDWLPSRER